MSMRRLKKLSGLTESIADDPHTNAEIERRLDGLPPAMRTPVLDALDVLKSAGPQGMTVVDWATQIREINGDPEMPMSKILKATVEQFPIVVRKIAPKTYAWEVVKSSDDEEFDPALRQAVGSQVELTNTAVWLMRSLGHFTARELARRLAVTGLVAPGVAEAFVDHLLTQFHGLLDKQGSMYTLKSEPPVTRDQTMQGFRDLVAKAKDTE